MKISKGQIIFRVSVAIIIGLSNIYSAFGQVRFTEPDTTGNQVIIDSSDVLRFVNGVKQLAGDVALRQGDARMLCDSAAIVENNVKAYGNVLIQQGDSVHVYSDTLYYSGNSRKSTFFGNVILTDSAQTLYTERLDYDLNTKIGNYQTGGKLVSQSTQLTSKKGYYYVNLKEAHFREDVVVVDSNYTLNADTLKIDTETQITYFLGPTNIKTKENEVYCESGFYDTRKNYAEFEKNARFVKGDQEGTAKKIRYNGDQDQFFMEGSSEVREEGRIIKAENTNFDAVNEITHFKGNVIVKDSVQTVLAENLDYYGKENIGIATGNVVLINEADDIIVNCETAEYNDKTGYLKASGRPFLSTLVDNDTLWLAADTLYSFKENPEDSFRILIADEDVRMYKENLQSISDSMVYSTKTESFQFYDDPVLWSDTTQFIADTVKVKMVDKVINRIDLIQNAFIISTKDSVFFNQIKGRDIIAHFTDSDLRLMNVLGNGESVYYIEDEAGAYVGVNKTVCSEMLVYFSDNDVEKIKFYQQPQATIYPMGQVSHKSLQMEGFKWLDEKRPRSKKDLR